METRCQGGFSQVSCCRTKKSPSPTHDPWLPWKKLIMLTEELKLWHGLVIAVVSLILQACLFAIINYLLSRHLAKENEQLLKRARLRVLRPNPAHRHSPAAQEMKETPAERGTPVSEPRCRDDSETSSDISDTSDNYSSSPPTGQATKDVNYTQVVFSATGRQKN